MDAKICILRQNRDGFRVLLSMHDTFYMFISRRAAKRDRLYGKNELHKEMVKSVSNISSDLLLFFFQECCEILAGNRFSLCFFLSYSSSSLFSSLLLFNLQAKAKNTDDETDEYFISVFISLKRDTFST